MANYKSAYTGVEIDAGIAKANTALQAHQILKTINNESLIGEGNIEITIPTSTSDLTNDGDGTSSFATENYVNEKEYKIVVPSTIFETYLTEAGLGNNWSITEEKQEEFFTKLENLTNAINNNVPVIKLSFLGGFDFLPESSYFFENSWELVFNLRDISYSPFGHGDWQVKFGHNINQEGQKQYWLTVNLTLNDPDNLPKRILECPFNYEDTDGWIQIDDVSFSSKLLNFYQLALEAQTGQKVYPGKHFELQCKNAEEGFIYNFPLQTIDPSLNYYLQFGSPHYVQARYYVWFQYDTQTNTWKYTMKKSGTTQ